MFWAVVAVAAISLLAIALSNRGAVRVVSSVLLGALLVSGLVLRLTSDPTPEGGAARGKPAPPATAITAIPIETIEVEDLKLTGGSAPFELRGTLRNLSEDTIVRSVTLKILRLDCYEGALDPSGCTVLWQDQHWVSLTVAPGTERRFATSFYARTPVSRLRGTLKDEFEIIAATGEAVAR